jgi:hypothetical protein
MLALMRLVIAACKRSTAMTKTIAALGALLFSAAASAGTVTGATITALGMGTAYGNLVFVSINIPKTGNPACSNNTAWNFVLPLTTALENQFLALLLAARATQTPVSLAGNGLCDTFGDVETLNYVTY